MRFVRPFRSFRILTAAASLAFAAAAEAQTLADAIDQPSFTVSGTGWLRQTGAAAHDGVDTAFALLNSNTTDLSRTLTAHINLGTSSTVTFWWFRTSNNATGSFVADGWERSALSGNGWLKESVLLAPGPHEFTWTVSRANTSVTAGLRVDELVIDSSPWTPPVPPVITAAPATISRQRLRETSSGQPADWVPWSHTITANPAPTSWQVTGLPSALTWTGAASLAISPAANYVPPARGTYQVNLSATNPAGTGTATWTLTVTDPPGVHPGQTMTVARSRLMETSPAFPWRYEVTATGIVTSWSASNLPPGVVLDTSATYPALAGQHAGSAPAAGAYDISVTATGPDGTDTQTVRLNVTAEAPLLNTASPYLVKATSLTGQPSINAPGSAWPIVIVALNGGVSSWNVTGLPAGIRWTGSAGQLVIDRTPGGPLPAMPAGLPPLTPVQITATNADGTTVKDIGIFFQNEVALADFPTSIVGRQGLPVSYSYSARWISGGGEVALVMDASASGLSNLSTSIGYFSGRLSSQGQIQVANEPFTTTNQYFRGTTFLYPSPGTPAAVFALNQTDLVLASAEMTVRTGTEAHDTVSCLRLGPLGMLSTTVTGPGTLSFWWKGTGSFHYAGVSSPAPAEWTKHQVPLTAVSNILTWRNPFGETFMDELRVVPAAAVDADGDGIDAAAEAWFGTSDTDPFAKPLLTTAPAAAGQVQLRFPSIPGNEYVLQSSSDLTNWTSSTIRAPATETLFTLPLSGPRNFWRATAP